MIFDIHPGLSQEFLFYHEKDPEPADVEMTSDSDTPLVTALHFLRSADHRA